MSQQTASRLIVWVWAIFLMGIAGVFVLFMAIQSNWLGLFGKMPEYQELENPSIEVASELFSADGVSLGKYFRQNRSPISYEDLGDNLREALLATEDFRFRQHSGIDLYSTASIPFYLLQGKRKGASTITQQLAKNLWTRVEDRPEYQGSFDIHSTLGKILVKLKEWILAVRLERSYTKNEIMAMYFNTMEWGYNAYGIKAATRTYFGVEPHELSREQAALLVGMLKGPTFYNPIRHPERARRRRNTVINQLARYDFISGTEADSLKQLNLSVEDLNVASHNTGLATYFRSLVREELMDWCSKNGKDLFADGLRIYTTINAKMQRYAEQAVAEHMQKQQQLFFEHWEGRNPWRNEFGQEIKSVLNSAIKNSDRYKDLMLKYEDNEEKVMEVMNKPVKMTVFSWRSDKREIDTLLSPIDSIRYYKHFLHCGLMAMEPGNGHVKAWVGGINHKYFKFDHVMQGARQPGSTFKPIVYATAIRENKMSPCNEVTDAPMTFTDPKTGTVWTPKNSDGYSQRKYTLREALGRSINTIAASLVADLSGADESGNRGARLIAQRARDFGITTNLDPFPAISLGTSDVKLYDLISAYGVFANRGTWTEPIFLLRIEDKDGRLLHEFVPTTREVLTEEEAYVMVHMLQAPLQVSGGTARGLWQYDFVKGPDTEVCGKTGTTSNYSDAWFMGFTKDLVAGVWSGAYDRSVHFRHIGLGQGAKQAMPAFAIFMEKVYKDENLCKKLGYSKGPFPKPAQKPDITLACDEIDKAINSSEAAKDTINYTLPETPF